MKLKTKLFRLLISSSLLLTNYGCSRNYSKLIQDNKQQFLLKQRTFQGFVNLLIIEVKKCNACPIAKFSHFGEPTLNLYSTSNNSTIPKEIKTFMDSLELTNVEIEYRISDSASIWMFETKENSWGSTTGQITFAFMPKGYSKIYRENEVREIEAEINKFWGMLIHIPMGPLE